MNLKIDMHKFYLIGVIALGVNAIMNTATLLQQYRLYITTALISQIASLVFMYAIWGFFWWLWKGLPPKEKPATDKEMENMLLEVNKKEVLK